MVLVYHIDYRVSQHRLSSVSSRRQSRERDRERERGSSNRMDDRSQRIRTLGSNERRIGTCDSRLPRRSRHSPRASESGSSGHHYHLSSAHTVLSTVVKLGASNLRRNESIASSEPLTSCGAHDTSCVQGLEGIYVSNLPTSRTESSLKDGLIDLFKKFGKIVHITFEMESGPNFTEQRRALIIFQRLTDVEKLKDVHHLFGLRLKIRFANHVTVSETYHTYLITSGQECSSTQDSASTSSSSLVDSLATRASRTLYVGGLERRTTDDSLRSRFSYFGHILETEVKNWESPSPFAFIQFTDIHSVVCAINAYAQSSHSSGSKGKLKIRVSFTDTFTEVIYDPRYKEALLLFNSNDSAQRAFTMIKTKQIAFWNADEKKDVYVPVDYCSEKLHDYFVDRKFRGESGGSSSNGTDLGSYSGSMMSLCGEPSTPSASTSLLAPPPDPPSHLRDTASRFFS
ncbi:unnamed protein product [Thelazia callipaeda]|uniref:RRM domain-containing protein n=1 Tax=Thelazia callipaeda TaxID=103827 RepID=A0A0N5CMZ5_THECL|nr:unnamed protein product [Thelazia callipaeda]